MNKYPLMLCWLVLLTLTSCTTLSPHSAVQTNVYAEEGVEFFYKGRGAGAGIALMSAMGPMGIAVGFAIDEGIKKDLTEAANSVNFDVVSLINSRISKLPEIEATEIIIKGFGMTDVGDDLFPFIELEVVCVSSTTTIRLDKETNSVTTERSKRNLQTLRESGTEIVYAFSSLIELLDGHFLACKTPES